MRNLIGLPPVTSELWLSGSPNINHPSYSSYQTIAHRGYKRTAYDACKHRRTFSKPSGSSIPGNHISTHTIIIIMAYIHLHNCRAMTRVNSTSEGISSWQSREVKLTLYYALCASRQQVQHFTKFSKTSKLLNFGTEVGFTMENAFKQLLTCLVLVDLIHEITFEILRKQNQSWVSEGKINCRIQCLVFYYRTAWLQCHQRASDQSTHC